MSSEDDSWSQVDPSSNMSSPITVIGSPSPSPPPLTPDAVHLQLKAGGDIPVAQPLKPANEKLGAVGWKLEGFIGALNSSPPLPHIQPDATVEIPVTQPPKSTKEEPGTLYERHETFFLDDGSVTFLVGNTLYRPHRFFFVRDSPWFAARLSTATAHAAQPAIGAGHANAEPITLDGVTSQDFDAFLSIIYPSRFDEHDAKTQAQWHSVLKLAHMWSFSSIRALAILHLDRCISPFDRLVYARMYGIEGWVVPALTALCSREDPLEVEEVEQMQARDIALVADVREQLRIPSEQSLSNAEEKVKSWLSGATKTTRLCTKRKKEAEERDRVLHAQALCEKEKREVLERDMRVQEAYKRAEREVEEAERRAKEAAVAARRAKEEAERRAKEAAARKAQEEAERKAREEDRRASKEGWRAREEDRRAKEEAERKEAEDKIKAREAAIQWGKGSRARQY